MEEQITHFAYDQMVERALRGVLREALAVTERQGLPGQNHFFITFRTDHPGVLISTRLKAQHPHTMTIVLQNQFWDLTVYEEAFGVTLSFSGRREHLTIPFDSVTAFADPHASFGLQFHVSLPGGEIVDDSDDDDDELDPESLRDRELREKAIKEALKVLSGEAPGDDALAGTYSETQHPGRRPADKLGAPIAPASLRRNTGPAGAGEDGAEGEGDNVITLDRFRKKT